MESRNYVKKTLYTTAAIAGLSFLLGYASPNIADAAPKTKTTTTKPARLETVAQTESANLEIRSVGKDYNLKSLEKFAKNNGMCDSTTITKGKKKSKTYDCKKVIEDLVAENKALNFVKDTQGTQGNIEAKYMAFQFVNKKGKNVYVAISHNDFDKKIDKIKHKIESGKYKLVGSNVNADEVTAMMQGTYVKPQDIGKRFNKLEEGQASLDKKVTDISAVVNRTSEIIAKTQSAIEQAKESKPAKFEEIKNDLVMPAMKNTGRILKSEEQAPAEKDTPKWIADLGYLFSASGVNGPEASIGYRLTGDKTLNLYFQKLNGGKNTIINNTITSRRDLNQFDGETYTNEIRDRTVTNQSKPTLGFGVGYEQEILKHQDWLAVTFQGRVGARYNEIIKTTEETLTTWLERNNTILPPGPIDTPGTPLVEKKNKVSGTASIGAKATLWDVVNFAVRASFDSNKDAKKQRDLEASFSLQKKF